MDDDFNFADEPEEEHSGLEPWQILIADDDDQVHSVSRLALGTLTFANRPIRIDGVYSGREAVEYMRTHDDVAVILMDVVMDDEKDGLNAIHAIRNELKNFMVRIILRTGQPGQAPERTVIETYDINDYKEKTELTANKLFSAIYTALRSYRDLKRIDDNRQGLEKVIESSAELLQGHSIPIFVQGMLEQLTALYFFTGHSAVLRSAVLARALKPDDIGTVLAATGRHEGAIGKAGQNVLDSDAIERIKQARAAGETTVFDSEYFLHRFQTVGGSEILLYLDAAARLTEDEQHIIDLYCRNAGLIYDWLESISDKSK